MNFLQGETLIMGCLVRELARIAFFALALLEVLTDLLFFEILSATHIVDR